MKKNCWALFIFLLHAQLLFAQSSASLINRALLEDRKDRSVLAHAEELFQDENFIDALPYYEKLSEKYVDDRFLIYRLGICYLYKSDLPEKSLEYLKKAVDMNLPIRDLPFFYARALHLNYLFNEAITNFQKYIDSKPGHRQTEMAKLYIEYCKRAKDLVAMPNDVTIKNLGKDINSIWSEYVPVISSDEAILMFTYRGVRSTGGLQNVYTKKSNTSDSLKQYYEDIFYSYRIGSHWLIPDPIDRNINTNAHDAAIALSADGQKLFVFKSNPKNHGDIYMSKLEGNEWSVPVSLGENINTKAWEGSCSLSANEKTLYFSSERSGGFGGKDIWKSELQADGTWGKPVNMGININTQYDEDAPFIHPDGKNLHFSSNGVKSMGGYDIFRSYLNDDSTWSKPQNIGYPINTVDDDLYYVVSADGVRGYYSSAHAGGYGMQDIYEVKPAVTGKKSALVALKGIITLDDAPAKAKVRVVNADSEQEFAAYVSNAVTGKYLVNLPTGNNYKIYYSCEGVNGDQVKMFNSMNVDYYMEATLDVAFYTNNELAKRAKNKLFIVNKDSTVLKSATQMRDGRFFFNYLPPDEGVMFKLVGEDVEFTNKLTVSVSGISKILLRGKDNLFRYDYMYPSFKHLSLMPSYDSLAPAKTKDSIPAAEMTYKQIVEKFGGYTASDMSFTVQVGAYYEAQNFSYNHLASVGKVETRNYNDGITRFTIGTFASLAEAEETRKRIVALGGETTDAFVLAVYQGKRILLKDLADKNFYNK